MPREDTAQVTECIHGLEVPLCDICYPKAAPEKPRAARAAAAPRTARSVPVRTSRKSINAGDQRIYHVTHIRNLEGIVSSGALLADAAPVVDVSSELTKELRMSAEVSPSASAGLDGAGRHASVAEYVPFYLAPDAALWEDLRAGAVDETRWSDAARKATPADFVFLVSTVGALGDGAVIADGDAAATFTRFSTGDGIQRTIEKLHDDEDARRSAEAMVMHSFPFESVQLIGVANDRVRDRVRELVSGVVPAPKVAVYPPWFQPAA
jgi:hypothetical protein